MKLVNLVVSAILVLFGSFAHAAASSGTLIQLAPRYESLESTSSGTTSKSTSLAIDFTGGYVWGNGFAFGLRYSIINEGSGTAVVNNTNFSAYGPALGYYADNGFFGLFSYLFSVTAQDDGANSKATGDGMQLDVGYIYRMGGSFGLGVQLAYQTLNYKKVTVGGTETTIDNKQTRIAVPSVVLNWIF